MARKIRAVQVGCGPIGCAVAKLALERSDIQLVGALDVDPAKVGRDLGEVAGLGHAVGIRISDDMDGIFSQARADLAFHQTGSSLKAVFPQLAKILDYGVNIVSSTEELAYPYRRQPDLAAEIDKLARANKATVLATGVNPGFLMDTWPLAMTAVCQPQSEKRCARHQGTKKHSVFSFPRGIHHRLSEGF
jgi:4-hydroxy-tetrahydrodipicolinate reductase